MEQMINQDKGVKREIIKVLRDVGCCKFCVLRYIGNADPYLYRKDDESVMSFLEGDLDNNGVTNGKKMVPGEGTPTEDVEDKVMEPAAKILRRSPCITCLGLLDRENGISDDVLDQVAGAVKDAGIETKSYTVNLSLPISLQFRAYFVWHRLEEKFPKIYECFPPIKPEGTSLKNVWKWICTRELKERIDPDSDWTTEGMLTINVELKYKNDETECIHLNRLIKKEMTTRSDVSRTNIDKLLKDMSIFEFKRKFGDLPPSTSTFLKVQEISCVHVPMFIAGRYNKYSRNVSQTPWFIDGKRVHDGSVEELISEHVLALMQAQQEKFSASGREDVDVRMLGDGRPFLMEVIQPKRTLFTPQDVSKLRDKINGSTEWIRVRDLQIVDKKSSNKIKEGEDSKTKNYCALCHIPDADINPDIIEKLHNVPLPIVLQQKTPIRVLHRRSLATRERSIYSLKAVPAKTKGFFKLYVKTQAGTYVKEFVHGDLGRTTPSIAELLGCNADIVSLDVENIDFPWPPTIPE